MDVLKRRYGEMFVVPRRCLIWPSLVLFLLGGAICSFNPPTDDGQHILRERNTMNSQSEGRLKEGVNLRRDDASSKTETATFALG